MSGDKVDPKFLVDEDCANLLVRHFKKSDEVKVM